MGGNTSYPTSRYISQTSTMMGGNTSYPTSRYTSQTSTRIGGATSYPTSGTSCWMIRLNHLTQCSNLYYWWRPLDVVESFGKHLCINLIIDTLGLNQTSWSQTYADESPPSNKDYLYNTVYITKITFKHCVTIVTQHHAFPSLSHCRLNHDLHLTRIQHKTEV